MSDHSANQRLLLRKKNSIVVDIFNLHGHNYHNRHEPFAHTSDTQLVAPSKAKTLTAIRNTIFHSLFSFLFSFSIGTTKFKKLLHNRHLDLINQRSETRKTIQIWIGQIGATIAFEVQYFKRLMTSLQSPKICFAFHNKPVPGTVNSS